MPPATDARAATAAPDRTPPSSADSRRSPASTSGWTRPAAAPAPAGSRRPSETRMTRSAAAAGRTPAEARAARGGRHRSKSGLSAPLAPAVLLVAPTLALGSLAATSHAQGTDDSTEVLALDAGRKIDVKASTPLQSAAEDVADAQAEREAQLRASRTAQRAALSATATRPVAAPKPKPIVANWVRPHDGRISSRFGPRWGRMHAGLDLAGPYGSPIRAVGKGVVTFAGRASGYGRLIKIQHENGAETAYGHMSKLLVTEGDVVRPGQLIALTGSEGRSTGPHLHFEVRIDGRAVNPLPWLRNRGVRI